jgi:hypothetical protein
MSIVVAGVIAVLVVLAVVPVVLRFRKYRGRRVIICPATGKPAGVELDAWLAANSEIDGDPVFLLKSCSRWPEHGTCDQACARQIEASPEGTLVRNIVIDWYRQKKCLYCRREFGTIDWIDALPLLRSPEGEHLDWHGVTPAEVPGILETHSAICWNCGLVGGFRREHPELANGREETVLRLV